MAIPGYEDRYEISEYGDVRCIHKHRRTEFLTKWSRDNRYLFVTLWKNGKRKHRLIHSLVLEAFYGPRFKNQVCRHKDGCRTNNHISNLEYGTVRENHFDKKRHGTFQEGEKHGQSKLTDNAVREIRKSNKIYKELAKEYGVCENTIFRVKNKQSWKHVALSECQ